MRVQDLLKQAEELLDILPEGRKRNIHFDMSKLAEEVGEVAECLNKNSKTKEDLAEELSDVIVVVCIIALKKKIDLELAITNKHKKRIKKALNHYHGGKLPLVSKKTKA